MKQFDYSLAKIKKLDIEEDLQQMAEELKALSADWSEILEEMETEENE